MRTGAGSSAFVGEVAAPGLARRLHRRIEAVATDDPFPGGAVNRVAQGVTIHPLTDR